jgi:hypothetical protein
MFGKFWNSLATGGFSRRAQLHEVSYIYIYVRVCVQDNRFIIVLVLTKGNRPESLDKNDSLYGAFGFVVTGREMTDEGSGGGGEKSFMG